MTDIVSLHDKASLTFRIFDRLLFSMRGISSPSRFAKDWKTGVIRNDLCEAVSFEARNTISEEEPDYLAEILIGDATPDPDEPYIPDIDEATLEEVDYQLMTDLSKEYPVVSWGGSRLGENKCGLKTLTSEYQQVLDGKLFQVLSVRLELLRPKTVLFASVDIERAPTLLQPIHHSIRQIEVME